MSAAFSRSFISHEIGVSSLRLNVNMLSVMDVNINYRDWASLQYSFAKPDFKVKILGLLRKFRLQQTEYSNHKHPLYINIIVWISLAGKTWNLTKKQLLK